MLLQYLAVVDISRIPLHLVVGPPTRVTTSSPDTASWFNAILLQSERREAAWWDSARVDSPLGVLVAADGGNFDPVPGSPRVTELLFYASKHVRLSQGTHPDSTEEPTAASSVTPELELFVIPLSSGLPSPDPGPTPPASSRSSELVEAVFLPTREHIASEVINLPPVRKRKDVNDALDEATERRKKAHRKGGAGVAAAAAVRSDTFLPPLSHSRTGSGSISQPHPPLSRSVSVASSRPTTAREASEASAKRSALSRVQSLSGSNEDSIETKNKDLITRIVMAGMRLFGYSRRKDEEYKLLYHQVFKGTCFAFRHSLPLTSLQPHTESIRETVDKLLSIFCTDPLADGLPGTTNDKLTPGGRNAFGSEQHTKVENAGLFEIPVCSNLLLKP